jgi:hypothetical protein
VLTGIGKKAVSASVRFVIRDIANRRADEGLSNSIQLMKGKITHAEEQWNDLLSYINSRIIAQEEQIAEDKSSTLTPAEVPE